MMNTGAPMGMQAMPMQNTMAQFQQAPPSAPAAGATGDLVDLVANVRGQCLPPSVSEASPQKGDGHNKPRAR